MEGALQEASRLGLTDGYQSPRGPGGHLKYIFPGHLNRTDFSGDSEVPQAIWYLARYDVEMVAERSIPRVHFEATAMRWNDVNLERGRSASPILVGDWKRAAQSPLASLGA